MSTKNHTKNELARISAKIQQLKRKYPTSSELYIHTQKSIPHERQPLHDRSHEINTNIQPLFKDELRHKHPILITNKSINQQTIQNSNHMLNQSKVFQHLEFNHNGRFYEERKQHQSCSKRNSFDKENRFTFDQDLNCQKPFKEYKEELKNLKKEILSSLDYQNFQLTKPKIPSISKIINNQVYDTFSKVQTLNSISSHHPELKQIQNKKNHLPVQYFQSDKKPQNNNVKVDEVEQYSQVINHEQSMIERKINFHSGHQKECEDVKQSIYPWQKMNSILQKLQEDFHIFRSQVSQKFNRFEGCSQKLISQNDETMFRLQKVQKHIQRNSSERTSQFDLKFIEIQNQAINKLSKELHNEMQLINAQIRTIKTHCYSSLQKQSSNSSTIEEMGQQIFESIGEKLKREMFQMQEQNLQQSQTQLKQLECKFLSKIFDIKNEIELLNQKLKKEDYMEKTLKSLMPQSARSISESTNQSSTSLVHKIKKQLLQNSEFIHQLKSFFFEETNGLKSQILLNSQLFSTQMAKNNQRLKQFTSQIQQKIQNQTIHCQSLLAEQLSKELNCVNQTLKQFQTKMQSYSILIENVQDGLKELSNSSNDDQIELELIQRIKSVLIDQIDSQISQKLQVLKENKHFQLKPSPSTIKESRLQESVTIPITSQQIKTSQILQQSLRDQVIAQDILPIINGTNLLNTQTSHVSFFTTQQESVSDIWLTNVEETANVRMASSEVRSYQRKPSKEGQSFLLDQLVKNSLVFSALNH